MQRIRFIASGRVQGVGFRGFACRIANSLQLVGYAKNLQDGTVELLLEGDERKIALFSKRVSGIRLALGVHVERLDKVSSEKINRLLYPSFSVAY
jgi:acylphosphatase